MVRITHDQTRVACKPDGRNSYLLALSITVTPASPQPSFPRKRESTAAGAPPLNSCSSNSSRFVSIAGRLSSLGRRKVLTSQGAKLASISLTSLGSWILAFVAFLEVSLQRRIRPSPSSAHLSASRITLSGSTEK